jgi:hypothetical protein
VDLPDWLERAAPSQLAVFLSKHASPRKAGLFIRHLCRCYPDLFRDPRSLAALDAADRFEAGEIDEVAYRRAVAVAEDAAREASAAYTTTVTDPDTDSARALRSVAVATNIAALVAASGFYDNAHTDLRRAALGRAGGRAPPRKNPVAPVMRPVFFEHFGDTEWPMALDPSWRTEAVVGLARGIYAERAFDRMPVLADALEDAGCAHPDVLTHCRDEGPHVRGCWVVDMLLGMG